MIRKEEKNPGKRRYFSLNPLKWVQALVEILVTNPEDKSKEEPEMDAKDPIDDEGLMKEKVKKT